MSNQVDGIQDVTRLSSDFEQLQGKQIGKRAGVRHTDFSPVFILGHGSSGTSILARLLREELGIAFGTESQFIIRYYDRLNLYGDLSNQSNLRRLVNHLLTERWFERSAKFGFKTDAEAILNRVQAPTYADVLDAIFSEFADQIGLRRWGSKTPEYNLNLSVLGDLFPNAKYIQMSRDGRDVFVSLANRYWGPKNIYCAATEWSHEVALIDQFLDGIPDDRKFATSYERINDAPAKELLSILEFLKIDDSDGKVSNRIQDEIRQKVKQGNYGKWKREMTDAQVTAYEEVACEQLMQHGYDTTVKKPAPEKSAFARMGLLVHNRLRKYMFARYWADNLYKARLRSVELYRRFFN